MPRPPERSADPLYFVNGWLDAAMIGGLSIVVFMALRLFLDGQSRPPAGVDIAVALTVFINYPHFSATVYRLYQSPANIRQFPVTSLGVPILILAAIAASIWQADSVAPYFITLFLFWSPFHYSGQTIGITLLYARRGKFNIGRWQRLALSAFVYATVLISFTRRGNTSERFGVIIPVIEVPFWFKIAALAVMCAAALVFVYFMVVWALKERRLPPPIIVLPALTQLVWFFPATGSKMFFEFIPTFHSLQYLYIAWAMQIGLKVNARAAGERSRSVVNESLRWGVSNYVGGMLLFIALPWLFYWTSVPLATSAGIVIAAVNIHHFFVDGVIWKLRNVSKTSPLLMNVHDWEAQPSPVPA